MRGTYLLTVSAIIETVTGLALIAFPSTVSQLLLGEGLAGAGFAVGRIAGFALLALGVACWASRWQHGKTSPEVAMFIYNSLTAIYLTIMGVEGTLVGTLLWPAAAVHAALSVLGGGAWLSRQPQLENDK